MFILSTAYFPPIEYFAALVKYSFDNVRIEAFENYQKQSYRNRCYFYGANGREMLQVPVVHENGKYELPIRDIRVDYSTPWVVRTERAIDSAYKSAAYFDYYRDTLFSILDSHPVLLWDLNKCITDFFMKALGLRGLLLPTEDFTPDGRLEIHPKRDCLFPVKGEYFQVFSDRHGFIPNLSVMDLVFNEGPESVSFIQNGI